jgi:hypothetical protein
MSDTHCPNCGHRISGDERWGCHVDLDPGQNPDACVLDTQEPDQCTHARELFGGEGRSGCKYWQKW